MPAFPAGYPLSFFDSIRTFVQVFVLLRRSNREARGGRLHALSAGARGGSLGDAGPQVLCDVAVALPTEPARTLPKPVGAIPASIPEYWWCP